MRVVPSSVLSPVPGLVVTLTSALAVTVLTGCAASDSSQGVGRAPRGAPVVVIPAAVVAELGERFRESTAHWDELTDLNSLERMLGTRGPTPRETLGCVAGEVVAETLRVRGLVEARDLRRLPQAVGGSCAHVEDLLGTWHTHPWREGGDGRPLKERRLSQLDLATFSSDNDALVLAVWDVDSVDAAARGVGGRVVHPARVLVTPSR